MEEIDTTVPHSARIWNYWLGGKDNYPVDRAAGEAFLKAYPGMAAEARANRQFLARAITYLVTEAGVRQFLTSAPAWTWWSPASCRSSSGGRTPEPSRSPT